MSEPPFHHLNLGFSTGDDPDRVRENRRRFFQALEVPPDCVVTAAQVHGARVAAVGRAERGRGALDPATALPAADGLVTSERGVWLLALSADCPLFALVAPPARGVLLAHAGWRGVAAGMPRAAVEALARESGAPPEEMRAVIGPSIAPCCYPVGEEVVERLPPTARQAAWSEGGRHRLDLARAIRLSLEEAGVPPEGMEASALCSSCSSGDLFSYRRDGGRTGRVSMLAGFRG